MKKKKIGKKLYKIKKLIKLKSQELIVRKK